MIHLHLATSPPRGETWLAGHRLWACASLPGERMGDVLRHLAAQLANAGVAGTEPVVLWPTGKRQHGPVRLASLAR